MKTITIPRSDVDAAMLVEAPKNKREFKGLSQLLVASIQQEYREIAGCKGWYGGSTMREIRTCLMRGKTSGRQSDICCDLSRSKVC